MNKKKLFQYPIGNSRTSYSIPDSVAFIGIDAFRFCTFLTSITIPDSVMLIDIDAFSSCTSLMSVSIPDSVTYIADYAFSSCTSLETVYYGGSKAQWNNITVGSFNDNLLNANIIYNYVTEVEFTGASGNWGDLNWTLDENGTLIIRGEGEMEDFEGAEQPLSLMPKAVSLNEEAWHKYSEYIVKVIIEEGVTSISDGAFANCENLVSISIPKSVTAIASTTFEGSNNLTSINYVGTEDEWNDIDVSVLPDSAEINYSTSDALLGDINCDEYIDNLDALMILKYDAGILNLSNDELAVADVNGDGMADNLDALMILKYDAGIIDQL